MSDRRLGKDELDPVTLRWLARNLIALPRDLVELGKWMIARAETAEGAIEWREKKRRKAKQRHKARRS